MDKEWLESLDAELRKDLEVESWEPPEGAMTITGLMNKTGWKKTRSSNFLHKKVESGFFVKIKKGTESWFVKTEEAPEWALEG